MVDLSELGAGRTSRSFSEFEKSAVERLAGQSSFDELAKRMANEGGLVGAAAKMRDALGLGTVGDAFRRANDQRDRDGLSKQVLTVDKAIADALGSRMGGYRRATDHMHTLFDRSISDDVQKAINGSTAMSEAEKYIASMEKSALSIPEMAPLPPVPPNPIHKTNQHLQNLAETTEALLEVQARQSEKVEALLEVQARQAEKVEAILEVQARQADMIDALLTAFVASTAEQGRSAKRNLWVAIISAVLALAAAVATIV